MFTQEEIDWWRRLKQEKFERDQAAQLEYADAEGEKRGLKKGREEGILGTITALKSLDLDKPAIARKLVEVFGLDDKVAQGYVEANW